MSMVNKLGSSGSTSDTVASNPHSVPTADARNVHSWVYVDDATPVVVVVGRRRRRERKKEIKGRRNDVMFYTLQWFTL